jgi:beta-galactosidase/beta-glucuronidase
MESLDLTGVWLLKGRFFGNGKSIPVEVPGGVHSALMAKGLIPDPRVGRNADELAWIGDMDWTFERPFTVSDSMLSHKKVDLECDGIDTFSDIYINDVHVLHTENMFKRWRVDVKDALKPGENVVRIEIESPFKYPEKAFSRKAKYGFGSEYSPECVTAGIFRPMRLRAWDYARIQDSKFSQVHSSNSVQILIEGTLEKVEGNKDDLYVKLDVVFQEKPVASSKNHISNDNSSKSFSAKCIVESPELWWPKDMGEQPLYLCSLQLCDSEDRILDLKEYKIGLRTLEIIENEKGEALLKCNGEPVFLKGGVWIPPGLFPSNTVSEDYLYLVNSAADIFCNSFYIWEGGLFEDDLFWELCDENGIVVIGASKMFLSAHDDNELSMGERKKNFSHIPHHACIADNFIEESVLEDGLSVVRDVISFPYPETLMENLPQDRLWINGPDMDERVSGMGGVTGLLTELVSQWPIASSFSDWIWLSQIAQAAQVCEEIARCRLDLSSNGIMWEPFASCWASADGSSIDDMGRWKALHYMAQRAFADVTVYGAANSDGGVDVRVSDLKNIERILFIKWRAMGLDGTTLDEGRSQIVSDGRHSSAKVTLDLSSIVEHYGENSIVVWLHAVDESGEEVARDFVLFTAPKYIELENPFISLDIADTMEISGEDVFRVTLSAVSPAFWVWLDIPGEVIQFSDNFVFLEPDIPVEIYVSPVNRMKQYEFRKRLEVRSLYDIKANMPVR